jgi:L-ascorbate metabolism protein UlaG (beta-lactamase superfamily)
MLFKNSYYTGPVTDHFDGKKFHNSPRSERTLFDLLKWMMTRKSTPWPESVPMGPTAKPVSVHEGSSPVVTFINHASLLLQWEGLNILFDPVWSERCSPFKNLGPKRVYPPGIRLEDLPKIDLILLSHNHYDHLDIETLKYLNEQYAPIIVTGLGNGPILGKSFKQVYELDWWQEYNYKNVKITYVPAQHFSARGIFDRNWALWGGFVLQAGGKIIYFAGDTGFCNVFEQIKTRIGSPDVAFLPIGAYEPRWFMAPAHMSSVDALEAHKVLGAKHSIAIHFGTFNLSDEGIDDPVNLLKSERTKRSISEEEFCIMKPGQTKEFLIINEL